MEERVTPLPAKASSFSGHVCGNPLRFVLKAPSEPQDVLCGVDVSVGHVAAGGAGVYPLRERLFDLRKSTAVATRLRGVLRVYRDNSHPSLLRFGCEDANKPRLACVMRALRKAGSSDALDAQGLVGYQPMPPYQSMGLFVVKVPPLVCGDLLVEPGDTLTSFTAAIRALLLPGKRTLSPPELLQSLPVVARRCYDLTTRGGKEALQSEVYADRRSVASGFGSIPNVADEDSVSLTARLLDGNGLYLPRNRAMQLDLDMPDVLEVKPPILLQPATIAVGGKLDQPEAVPVPEAWIARCFTDLQPAEERFEGAIQPPERSLSAKEVGHRKVRLGPVGFLESARLLTIGDDAILGLVDIPAFCESVVVQTAVSFDHRIKSFRLRAVRIQAVFERFLHATTLLTKPDVLNGEKGGVMRLPRYLKQTAPAAWFL